MNKAILLIIFLSFSISSFCQEKVIELHIPNSIIYRHGNDNINIYRIRTNNDGYVSRVESLNVHDYSSTEVSFEVGRITLKARERGLAINEILVREGGIFVRGVPTSIYTKDSVDFSYISIHENQDIIFEHEELKLIKLSEKSLDTIFKINPSRFTSITYFNNMSLFDYRFKNNTMNKFVYNGNDNGYSVTYHYLDDEYSPDVRIYGDNLYTSDIRKNVINFFILSSAEVLLARFLFPTIFLEHPFSFNNRIKNISSVLPIGNAEMTDTKFEEKRQTQ
jgi:hypothetical protein